jgi:hypothetical protein
MIKRAAARRNPAPAEPLDALLAEIRACRRCAAKLPLGPQPEQRPDAASEPAQPALAQDQPMVTEPSLRAKRSNPGVARRVVVTRPWIASSLRSSR